MATREPKKPKPKDEFESFINKLTEELRAGLFRILLTAHFPPSKTCCGKPVVFIEFGQGYQCTRCGKKWRLVMEVVEVVE